MLALKNTWYEVVETQHYTTLYEQFVSKSKSYRSPIAKVTSWRRDAVRYLLKRIKLVREDGKEVIYDPVEAMRVYVAFKVLNSIKRPELKYRLTETLLELPPEEIFFWAWKVSANGRGKYAFRVLYQIL